MQGQAVSEVRLLHFAMNSTFVVKDNNARKSRNNEKLCPSFFMSIMSDDLTMIECLLAGRKMKLQDISSIKWKETKVAHPGVFDGKGRGDET